MYDVSNSRIGSRNSVMKGQSRYFVDNCLHVDLLLVCLCLDGPVLCFVLDFLGLSLEQDWRICLWDDDESNDAEAEAHDGSQVLGPSPGELAHRNKAASNGTYSVND
jgi:hypothetical protein